MNVHLINANQNKLLQQRGRPSQRSQSLHVSTTTVNHANYIEGVSKARLAHHQI